MELRGAMAALFQCRDREVLVEGRAGTAKTTGILWKVLKLCKEYPGSRHLLCRDTRTRLTESAMVTLERLIGVLHPEVLRVQRIQRHSYKLFGSEIVCGGMDDPQRLFSTEWDTVYVNEATEISEEAWELFGRAMRHNRMPYQQRIADCNPSFPGHWLNKRATECADALRLIDSPESYNRLQAYNFGPQDGQMRRLVSVHQDNPGYFDLKAWKWTPQGQEYVEGVLAKMSGYRRARMFLGLWRAGEGTVYPEFDLDRHVIKGFPIPEGWPIFCGLDPGFDHPCAWIWLAVAPNGNLYVIDEICGSGIDLPQLVKAVKSMNATRGYVPARCLGDPQYIFKRLQEAPSVRSQMRGWGVTLYGWPRTGNQMDAMVGAVRSRLLAGTIKVFRRCSQTIEAFQGWRYKRNAKGGLTEGDEDKYEQLYKDPMDVVRGLVAARLDEPGAVRVVGGDE